MELRTPAPLSDDEIYHFAETATDSTIVQASFCRTASRRRCVSDADAGGVDTPDHDL